MRKKIAMRWRRKALGMGADILEEGVILKKPDLLKYKEKKKNAGFAVTARYGIRCYTNEKWEIHAIGRDSLEAYKLLAQAMMDMEHDIPNLKGE